MLPATLTIGELARRSGVAVSALRFYESKGLIFSVRTSGNQRRYARDTLRRVGVIKAAKRVGIPLDAIQKAFESLPDGRTPTDEDWRRLSDAWRADLEDRIARLTLLRDRLTGCIGCGCLSVMACPLLNPDDEVSSTGAGPRFLEP